MNSGEFVAMAEPATIGASIYGLAKWSGAGITGGLAYAVAAIETNPERAMALTPDLNTSVYALALAIVGYAMKAYMPSEKKVDSQHQHLVRELEKLAEKDEKETNERREHRAMLHRWMGGVDEKLSSMSGNLEDVTGRLVRIERSQKDSGEIRRPTQ